MPFSASINGVSSSKNKDSKRRTFGEPNQNFLEIWHYYGYWGVLLGKKYDKFKTIGLVVRSVLFTALATVALLKIATDGMVSVLNGTMLYIPLSVYTLIIPPMLFIKRKHLVHLLADFDDCWVSLYDESDQAIFKEYYERVWKFIRLVHLSLFAQLMYYVAFPIVINTVFHNIFDVLPEPYVLSYPHMSFLSGNEGWGGKYYAVVLCGAYCIIEIELALWGWLLMYLVIIGYCYPVLLITKKCIQDIERHGGVDKRDPPEEVVRKALLSHRLLIKISRDLKAYLGLPCAFQTIFTSLCLTMTVFTTFRSSDFFIIAAYGSAIFLYGLSGLLYCTLGQLLENKSGELFDEIYNLPWYNYSPKIRMDLNMMLRQSRTPFTINYNNSYKMNLENYMEILKNAYSFFTLLETLASQD